MNKEFIKKIIMAEKYKYEAIKEILPNDCKKKLERFEMDTFDLVKDVVSEILRENGEVEENKKAVKKIDIDFTK